MKYIPFIYGYPIKEYALVFINEHKAYFSTKSITFDDWEECPYIYHAGSPQDGKYKDYAVTSLFYEANLFLPHELGNVNYSINYINEGNVPWLQSSNHMGEKKEIMAGISMDRFIENILSYGGEIWLNYNQFISKGSVDKLKKYANITTSSYLKEIIKEI
jgi:hypothetical protein